MVHRILACAAGLFLAGCVGVFTTEYQRLDPSVTREWQVAEVNFAVPPGLSLGSPSVMAPDADIVWFGEPPGDRREQVDAIMTEAITRGTERLQGQRPVIINASLIRFHAVTPLAVSQAPEAVHDIAFRVEVLDAGNGARLTQAMRIDASLPALTGAAAVIANDQGQSQKVRITDYVAATTAAWLGVAPDNRRSFTSLGR
jgi:hypothetical protein